MRPDVVDPVVKYKVQTIIDVVSSFCVDLSECLEMVNTLVFSALPPVVLLLEEHRFMP